MNRVVYLGELRTECFHEGGARLVTDAPRDNEGKGEQFSPTDLFTVSLGSCVLTIMGIAARKHNFNLIGATAEVEKEMSQEPPRRVVRIVVRVSCPPCPDEGLRKKLEHAGMACPVHYSLHPDIRQEISFTWG